MRLDGGCEKIDGFNCSARQLPSAIQSVLSEDDIWIEELIHRYLREQASSLWLLFPQVHIADGCPNSGMRYG